MKETWIIANWKSHKNIVDALNWLAQVGPRVPKNSSTSQGSSKEGSGLKVVVCPPFSDLSEIKKAIQIDNFPIIIGSQDLSPFDIGAYTGEEPAELLKQFVEIAILGHSERRENFGETDQIVAEKTKQAVNKNIIPLVCVQNQDTPVPPDCKMIAYEPIFAIGSGNPDTPENADRVAKIFKEKYGAELTILYGGSVNSQNAASFVQQENITGLLIGTASLDADEFIRILEAVV